VDWILIKRENVSHNGRDTYALLAHYGRHDGNAGDREGKNLSKTWAQEEVSNVITLNHVWSY
jgi:hypothetical protein